MPRYFSSRTKPRADWFNDDRPMIPHLEVSDHEATWTGLLDADGEPIMRMPNPIGFGRDEEW